MKISETDTGTYWNHDGLYSSKGEYIVLPEYDKIEKTGDNIWVCYKKGEILVVETEDGD